MNSPPILAPILVVGLNRMFTGATIWLLTHGPHGSKAPRSERRSGALESRPQQLSSRERRSKVTHPETSGTHLTHLMAQTTRAASLLLSRTSACHLPMKPRKTKVTGARNLVAQLDPCLALCRCPAREIATWLWVKNRNPQNGLPW